MTVSILPPILISSLKAKEAAIVSSSSSVTPPPPQPSLFSLTAVSPSSCFTCEENLQKFTFCSSSLSSVVECSSPIISSVPLPPPPCMQYPLRLKPKLGVPSYPSTSSSSLSFIHQLKLLLLVLLSWLLVSFMKTVLQFPENFKTLLSFVSRKTLNLWWSCEQHSKYYVSHHSSLPSVVKPLQMKLTETRTDGKGNPKRRKTSSININSSSHHHHISKSYKLLYGKDFIYVIALSLCLLSPSMASVITSNEIFPMDAASSQADRDVNGELSIPVEGVVGKRIELPCDISPSRRDDTVYMVLWFRGEESIPIYSLDVRGKHVGGGKPWSAEKPFGKRAYFQSTSEPARLIVEGAQISDQGIYRCRVDFRNSPSREARLNLTTIVPPNEPQIYDATGMSTRGEIGPFIEGSIVELTCIVREGVPSPMVQWYLNDELVDSSYHVKNDKEVINHISVPNIQRSLQRASLSCRASNTLLVPPVTKTVYFELNLRPLTVSIPIKHRNPQLTAETQYEIKCESWGSHPPPMMTWWLDGREEKGASIEESKGSNNTVSRLFFTPNASNDGQVLTCRVENPHVTAGALEDSWKLRVSYPPVLHLRMGSSLNPRDIKEGDDVYFECHIRANPQVHKLAWYHNGLLLHHNRSAGVILSNQSLVLQKVTRPSAGNYSCRASNVQGEGNSNNVILNIMYAPACQSDLSGTDAAIIIAASRSEVINITCEMDALPNKLTFQWTHTNTVGENAELESDMYTSAGSKSLLRYHLRSEEDFGTILCWASNSIGDAERPCIYQLVPADVPQPVENCSIINRTSTSVEITCEPGFDGGLPQSFLFEAYQTSPTERRGLFTNITLDKPTFALSRLDTDGTFHFKIYSVNRKGRSSASIMDGIVLRYPVMQSAKTRDLEKTTVAIIIGAASAVTLGFISLIAFIIHRIRHPISAGEMEKSYSREFGSNRRGEDDDFYRNDMKNPVMGITFTGNSNFDEDGDPDLIPTSKNVKAAAMGSVYSRLSNGEINQRYVASSGAAAQECMDPPSLSLSSMQCTTAAIEDPYNSQAMPNYATCRGKPNGLGLKEQHPLQHLPQKQNQQQQHRPMVSSSSTSFQRGKSSTLVVNIDTRLIGQQLASSHLPESCV